MLAQGILEKLRPDILLQAKRVTALVPRLEVHVGDTFLKCTVEVSVHGEESPRSYDHVISTVPMGCLRMIDTSKCNLSWDFQTAMRCLNYDASVKVALKFRSRWWEELRGQIGGVSYTDRPTRTVVYPSYGIGGPDATMIVSYTWAQDALRFGGFTGNGANLSPSQGQLEASRTEQTMIDIILKDLADIHDIDYNKLRGLLVDYRAYNWYGSPDSAGAFALFGPGQFSSLYPEVTKPPGGVVHFAGEATSVHHAWVVGALNSAYRTVHEILYAEGRGDLIAKMKKIWGTVDEIDDPLLGTQVKLGMNMLLQ